MRIHQASEVLIMLRTVVSLALAVLLALSVSYAGPFSPLSSGLVADDVDRWTICVISDKEATHKACTEERLSTAGVPYVNPNDPAAIRESSAHMSDAWVGRSAVVLVHRNHKMTRGIVGVSIDYLTRVIDVDLTYVE